MTVLLIGGLDSSTGAGLARDLAVMCDHDMTARVAATAVTAQDSAGGCSIHPIPATLVAAQIRAAGQVRAAKTGMLANADIVHAIAETLPEVPFVIDPVLATSAGAKLLERAGCAAMIARLIPRATLVTPNLLEAAQLTGLKSDAEIATLAAGFFAMGARAVLIKGGHADGPEAVDWLLRPGSAPLRFASSRKPGSRRGTGCTLASAIAVHLARGHDLATACEYAKRYLSDWL
ncbi:hydroxymethylpyrimidine/phosphomethylpyrimidine kinase [Tabrizicola sp.]|uniref:hydroxymethylpyrimidine/phosphomethylpyrimidine kinase n=1 Tax=Tabrizicola sp. TaxID=2005166 RepID=UPI002735272F|nr:hydroxymethylpyrimidine/phosphomethylpyrimidine kinase [Tabrizicola sp.]MDP3197680.1 hydroxymethylpyrimidine/phosphomethylpyrimidine kinase [Tabrizicola sp.]MDZ4065957.1 hydroxymethylpyrimidine/phosphomethylpyrimidine kinase [Tabrizicola sp.]